LGHANPPEGHQIIQIPYFDLCYSSGDEELKKPFVPKIKFELGTEQGTEFPPESEGHGPGHLVQDGLSYSQHQPVGAFPYSQQDPFPEEQENNSDAPVGIDDDKEEDHKEKHVVQNQQVFCIANDVPRKFSVWRNWHFFNIVNPADTSIKVPGDSGSPDFFPEHFLSGLLHLD